MLQCLQCHITKKSKNPKNKKKQKNTKNKKHTKKTKKNKKTTQLTQDPLQSMSLFFVFWFFRFFNRFWTLHSGKPKRKPLDPRPSASHEIVLCLFFGFAISQNSYAHPVWLIVFLLSFNLLLCYLSSPWL